MMDMEMNADLGGDEGSESIESSSEGSSASITFCTLEKDYARIAKEMKVNEALAPFEAEYTRLYESLYKAHRTEQQLSEQCISLKKEIVDNTQKIYELREIVDADAEEIAKLKEEIVRALKLADAAHAREQNAQETIENLRLNITKLNQELEHKNRQLATEKDTSVSKQKEGLLKERERLMGEMETLRERLKNMSSYTEELERRTTASDRKINEMQESLDVQLNEVSKERRAREKAEAEIQQLQEELKTRTDELQTANETIKSAADNITKLEASLKECKSTSEKTQKELSRLMVKRMNLQTDLDNANVQLDTLEKESSDKDKQLRSLRHDLSRAKEEASKFRFDCEIAEKRLSKVETERLRLEQELKRTHQALRNSDCETQAVRKQLLEERQRLETLTREKNLLARSRETAREHIKKVNHELVVSEHGRKKIEQELDNAVMTTAEAQRQLEAVEKDRDRYNLKTQELAQQVEEYVSEVKLKQAEILDYKKRLAEAEARHRQNQNLFEAVRAERNLCNKSLIEALDQIDELKSKLKVTGQQIEQLKEEVAAKEADLVKKEFLLGRVEKEKESLRTELQSSRKEITAFRREIEGMKDEEKRLRQTIQQADADISRRKKDIDNVMNERDILGAQLVRRNDELGLQYNRIKVLNGTLQRGEAQYNQRLEDIRLLKLEVKKLRTEKTLLSKSINNMADLRQEIFHLNRDLARERLKVVALEEEVQTPLNIHRWRKLEGSDPETYELVRKVQILQKRVLKMAGDMIEKERKIRDTEKLYMSLREILSKQPGPQVTVSLDKTQRALRERGKKMKCLVAELNMYEVQISEYRIDMERMGNEMCDLKRKYYTQKRQLQKVTETKPRSEPLLPPVSPCRRFYGGGFNMTTPTPRNFVLDSTSR